MALRKRRAALTSGLAALCAVAGLGLAAAPAHADPPSTICNPDGNRTWEDVVSARTEPVVTEFAAVNVTPGTTGQYNTTLAETAVVNTAVNGSTEMGAEYQALFANVGAKVGFAVADTKSSTRIPPLTEPVNFSLPGYYGRYRGFQKVTGEWARYICARTGPGTGIWIKSTSDGGTFTTFGNSEKGTVSCASPEPAGTLRAAARLKLSC
ncbi:hypothetical protein ACIQOW_30790 [Kitasatospora sp. NPDC091335]|uniref:hypothetical protein n=1 Tax=Kitasatospora sp. NPDC091335 TaxID=3364085 RepID=UPI00382141D8